MVDDQKIPLKEFWDALEQALAKYSAEELRGVLRAMAETVHPAERQSFLAQLKPQSKKNATTMERAIRQDKLLADIDDLANEIENESGAEDWDEDHHGWDDDYDDEDSVGPYERFIEPLSALFERAQATFDLGDLKLARAAYEKLFAVTKMEDDYGRGLRLDDLPNVDGGEARARYLRAVYETTAFARRPQVLCEQMQQSRHWVMRAAPMLNDVIQIARASLPDAEKFFEAWIAYLRTQPGPDADAWLREAVRLAHGTAGLAELARQEGKKRPRAYVDWFAALEREGNARAVFDAAQDALKILPVKAVIRAEIADHLFAVAKNLGESEMARVARWEAFLVAPTLTRLLDVLEITPSTERTLRMQQSAARLQDYLAHPPRPRNIAEPDAELESADAPAFVSKVVLAHAHLLAEEWEAAQQLAAREQVLGWSSTESAQGLVVAFYLAAASGKSFAKLPNQLNQQWRAALEYSGVTGYWDAANARMENKLINRLHDAYVERMTTAVVSPAQQTTFLAWCLDVATKRVNAIVGEQHRKSYGKAATLVAACAEALKARGEGAAATAFVNDVRNRFPRHRAFLSDLNAAL